MTDLSIKNNDIELAQSKFDLIATNKTINNLRTR